MAESDLSTWLTIADAAAQIGCSTRTVERLGRAKQLEQRLRPQAGSPAVAVYNPDDVARIAAERLRRPAPFVLPALQTSAHGNGHREPAQAVSTRLTRAAGDDPIGRFFAFALQALQSPPSPPVAEKLAETLYVTVEQAAAILNWTPRDLRWEIREGHVPCRRPSQRDWRTWRIRRKDLEQL